SAIEGAVDGCFGFMLPIDDSYDPGENGSGSGKQLGVMQEFTLNAVRATHNPVKLRKTKVMSNRGYVLPPKIAHARRSFSLSGENLEIMGLNDSTGTRALSWSVNDRTPLLRMKGEVDPLGKELSDTAALSWIRAGIISARALRFAAEHGAAPVTR